MSLGDTFSMSGPPDPDAPSISDDMRAALAKAFPDSAPAEPDVPLPDASEIADAEEGGDGSAAVSPLDLAGDLDLDPAGGPGDLPADLTPAQTDGFVIADTPTTPAAEVQAPPLSPSDELDLNDLFTRHIGSKPTREQMTSLLGFIDSFSALSPQQQAQVNAIVSGQAPPEYVPATQQYAPAPMSQQVASNIELPDLSTLDDGARALLQPLYDKVAQQDEFLQQQLVAQQQVQIQQQQRHYEDGALAGSTAFIEKYSPYLTSNDMVIIETRAKRGNIQLHLQNSGGDMAKAYESMLEATLFADPDLRTRVAQATTAQAQAQATADAQRVQLAAAVSAGGSPATPPTPTRRPRGAKVDPAQTKMDRDAARQAAMQEAMQAAAAKLSAESGLSVR